MQHVHITVESKGVDYDIAVNTYSNDNSHLRFYFDKNYTYNRGILKELDKHLNEGEYKDVHLDFIKMDLFPKNKLDGCNNEGNECTILDQSLYDVLHEEYKKDLCSSCTIFVFGEPYSKGDRGIHNVHMNQCNSNRYSSENDSNQDGAIFVRRKDGTYAAYFSMFKSQSFNC